MLHENPKAEIVATAKTINREAQPSLQWGHFVNLGAAKGSVDPRGHSIKDTPVRGGTLPNQKRLSEQSSQSAIEMPRSRAQARHL
jgi:hypothetical protein